MTTLLFEAYQVTPGEAQLTAQRVSLASFTVCELTCQSCLRYLEISVQSRDLYYSQSKEEDIISKRTQIVLPHIEHGTRLCRVDCRQTLMFGTNLTSVSAW